MKRLPSWLTRLSHIKTNMALYPCLKRAPDWKGIYGWCDENDNTYWTEEESNGLAIVRDMVLNKGWESSGYAIMMRNLQNEINKIT